MSIYDLLFNSVGMLLPDVLTPQLESFQRVASLILLCLCIYVLIKFVIWCFSLFSRIGR